MAETGNSILIEARNIQKSFRRNTGDLVKALDGVSFQIQKGTLTSLVGPDGAGKTTFLRLVAGLLKADSGNLTVLGIDAANDPQSIQSRIGYMPQKFGLYEDLSVQENLDLYADLHGVSPSERTVIYQRLMEMTNLGRFTERLAGKLSGGMKQKLGLACTLVRSPEVLLLDEPTVGVDPLSRRELWDIVNELVHVQKLTVVVCTSYLDEAEFGHSAVIMHLGKILAQGTPQELTQQVKGQVFRVALPPGMNPRSLQARLFRQEGIIDAIPEAGQVRIVRSSDYNAALHINNHSLSLTPVPPRFEDAFMKVFNSASLRSKQNDVAWKESHTDNMSEIAVEVQDLVRTFGDFTAVNHISFQVHRGEIYGLLGANGAGKSTTFRMLCGLLPATGGTLKVGGTNLRTSRAEARTNLGYVAQKFSLYGDLSVDENLDFFASAYGLRGAKKEQRIVWAKQQFELDDLASLPSAQLPGGYKQRLAMAAALLHEPAILFLDEATSGADPLARREFWGRITALSEQGVTVIVTTHFMEEAEYCDRIIIMDSGNNLAEGTPADIRSHATVLNGQQEPTMEDAFIAIIEQARNKTFSGITGIESVPV